MGRGSSNGRPGSGGGGIKQGQSVQQFIKDQTGVDIEKYRDSFTKQFDSKDFTVLYWKDVPKTDRAAIQSMATAYGETNFVLSDVGAWGKAIITGDKKEAYLKQMQNVWGA